MNRGQEFRLRGVGFYLDNVSRIEEIRSTRYCIALFPFVQSPQRTSTCPDGACTTRIRTDLGTHKNLRAEVLSHCVVVRSTMGSFPSYLPPPKTYPLNPDGPALSTGDPELY